MEMFWLWFIVLFGLVIGSFLNVVTIRIATGESFAAQRSHCPSCKHALGIVDLVPVLSYVWLRGKCRYCQTHISWQYPLVEIGTAIAFGLVVWSHGGGLTLALARDLVFTAGLLALFIFDVRWYIVPDEVSLPLGITAVVANLAFGMSVWSLGLGIAVGAGLYFALWALSGGRWVGSGDIRLGFVLGAMVGWPQALGALYIAYMVGGVTAAVLLLLRKKKFGGILPMGTFLTTGTLCMIVFGDGVVAWWMKMFA